MYANSIQAVRGFSLALNVLYVLGVNMLKIGDLNYLNFICSQCELSQRIYIKMKRIVGVKKSIFFRLNLLNLHKPEVRALDKLFLATLMLELQNPNLQTKNKELFLNDLLLIVDNLLPDERKQFDEFLNKVIYD